MPARLFACLLALVLMACGWAVGGVSDAAPTTRRMRERSAAVGPSHLGIEAARPAAVAPDADAAAAPSAGEAPACSPAEPPHEGPGLLPAPLAAPRAAPDRSHPRPPAAAAHGAPHLEGPLRPPRVAGRSA